MKIKKSIILFCVISIVFIIVFVLYLIIPPEVYSNNIVYSEDIGIPPKRQYMSFEKYFNNKVASLFVQSNELTPQPVAEIQNIFSVIMVGNSYVEIMTEYPSKEIKSGSINRIYWNNGKSLLIPVKGIEVNDLSNALFDFYSDNKGKNWYVYFYDKISKSRKSFYLDGDQAHELKDLNGRATQFYTNNKGEWYVLAGDLFKITGIQTERVEGAKGISGISTNKKGEWVAFLYRDNNRNFIAYSLKGVELKMIMKKSPLYGSLSLLSDDKGNWFLKMSEDMLPKIFYFIDKKNHVWRTFNTIENRKCDEGHGCYNL